MTGIDVNLKALADARQRAADNPLYLEHDMRQVATLPGTFDAILCLWQSFGYFAETINRDILRQMRAKLNPYGRLVLDTPNVAVIATFLSNTPANGTLNATGIASPKRKR